MSDIFPNDTRSLDAWLATRVAGYSGPSHAHKFQDGQSNPTYLLTTPSARYVLRRKPSGKLLKSAHMIEREYRVLVALEGAGFPAPRPLAFCEEDEVLGSAFYLMSYIDGCIFWDPAIPSLSNEERGAVYDAMNESLAMLHSIDVAAVGLSGFGKSGNYFARQLQRWTEQYWASETRPVPDMDHLIAWLGAHLPTDDGRIALVHGDWRIDNLIFSNGTPQLLGVLDWELSTLGHPFADLAYQCAQWRLSNTGEFRGLGGVDRLALGIPSEADYVAAYCRHAGLQFVPDWPFLLGFSLFRMAAIAQGVYKRSLDGNASNPDRARKIGAMVPLMANLAIAEIGGS